MDDGFAAWAARVELQRRLVHAAGIGFPLLYLLGVVSWRGLGAVLAVGTLAVGTLEFLRLVVGLDHAVYDRLTRSYEQENVAGYALYMVGMSVAWLLFDPAAAVAGMLMLALGDPVSGALGSNDPGDRKRLTVLGAMFLVCFAVAAPLAVAAAGPGAGVVAAAAGAVGATAADGVTPVVKGYVVDDNLTIPPAGGVGVAAVLWLVGTG